MNKSVCFIGAEITPSGAGGTFVGGSVNTVVGLCKGLTNLGWNVQIVTTPSRFLKSPKIEVPWAKIHVINATGAHNSLAYDLDFLRKASEKVETLNSQFQFDVIHGHSGYFSLSIIPLLVKRKLRLPTLFSLYCPASMLPRALPLDRFPIRAMSFKLDRIIAVTENVKQSLLCFGVDSKRISVIPSCYDEGAFDPSKIKVAINPDAPVILFVGNAHRTKGLDILFTAVKLISSFEPAVRFIITLHEPKEVLDRVNKFVTRELGPNVTVLGVVKNMAELVASVDIIVAPFRSTDGISDIPIIILEAMALGKPVVASDLPGIKEAVDSETGIILEDNNAEQLVFALRKLVDSPELCMQMGKKGMVKVKNFSYSAIAKRLSSLYNRVAEENVY